MLAFMFGGFELILLLGGLLFSVLFLAFWVWMLIDCAKSTALSDTEKVVWIVIIALTHVLGAVIYLLAGRKRNA